MNLNDTSRGKRYRVKSLNVCSSVKYKLFNFGITEGAEIAPFIRSPFGGVCAYTVNDTLVAIRNSDAKGVEVEQI